jgi:hypothetical protein
VNGFRALVSWGSTQLCWLATSSLQPVGEVRAGLAELEMRPDMVARLIILPFGSPRMAALLFLFAGMCK